MISEAQTERISGAAAETSLRQHILVVEDHEHTAYLLEFMLQRAGYDVTVLNDGREATRFIDSQAPVNLAILDLMLPYSSGFQLLRQMRGGADWMYVPTIIVSAKVLEKDITQAFDLGADDYVSKPFKPNELLARVRRSIQAAERIRGER